MSMAVGGAGGGPKCDMNMTPMIDVLLVLIIIFMVITPLTPKGLEALVPQPPPPGAQANQSDTRTVVITIDGNHTVMINGETDEWERLAGPPGRYLQDARQSGWYSSRAIRAWSSSGSPKRSTLPTAPESTKSA